MLNQKCGETGAISTNIYFSRTGSNAAIIGARSRCESAEDEARVDNLGLSNHIGAWWATVVFVNFTTL
jgi:hypothetical protein